MNEYRNESRQDADSAGSAKPRLLFVDDDRDIQAAARLIFGRRGIDILSAFDARDALTAVSVDRFDLVLLDLNYTKGATSGAEGLTLLRDILLVRPDLPVVVVTGHSGVTIAVEAMRAGATDFVMKPWHNERLAALVNRLIHKHGQRSDTAADLVMIVGSDAMFQQVALADRLAATRAHVLLCGAPGTGKTLLARRIHARSDDDASPVVFGAADCDALPQMGGTWICRDIEALSPVLQHRLADRLDEPRSPRVLALSACDRAMLEQRVVPRLMLHLGAARIDLPSLRDRPDDIPVLVRHFLKFFATRHTLPSPVLDDDRVGALRSKAWPQNIRELRATVERAVLMGAWTTVPSGSAPVTGPAVTLRDTERSLIEVVLRRHGFNVTQAARELGITRPALYRRMARHGL